MLGGVYEVLEPLGQGAMGTVHAAHDHRLGRSVAIKFPSSDTVAPFLVEEARALAAIAHPALPSVHALLEDDGVPYLVMERVAGPSLERVLDVRARGDKPLSVLEALDLLDRLAEALGAVHAAGLVHRDVKPANVVLGDGRPVLVDFGLARPAYAVQPLGQVTGSPAYLAPEVIRDDVAAGQAHLADLYALGVVGYELLTFETPFHGPVLDELLAKHLHEPVPDVRRSRGDVPAEAARLLSELMAKDPAGRPQSAEEVRFRIADARARCQAMSAPDILVVDDDPGVAWIVRTWLSDWLPAARVTVVEDGLAAMSLLRRRRFHLVISDLQMPQATGLELTMFVRGGARTSPIDVVVMSGSVTPTERDLLERLGAAAVLEKGPNLQASLGAFVARWSGGAGAA